ncbi:MAG TPA: hypothetical protein VGC39_01705, partial [Candidatus Methylacidiphilales bacterium]
TLGLYSEGGTWTLTSAEIYLEQLVGGAIETTYDQAQLEAMFTNLSVNVTNNGTPDYTPPIVSAGKILTPIVHAENPPGFFKTSLTVQDEISGVNSAFVIVEPAQSGGPVSYDEPAFPAPVFNGTVGNSIQLNGGGGALEGPYWIVGYGATDVAGNAFVDDNSADIKALFGRRFFWVVN